MLDPAGILSSHGGIHADGSQPVRKKCVTFIDFLCNFPPLIQQGDVAFLVHFNIFPIAEILHSYADAGLGVALLVTTSMERTEPCRCFKSNGLQIIFCGIRAGSMSSPFLSLFNLNTAGRFGKAGKGVDKGG